MKLRSGNKKRLSSPSSKIIKRKKRTKKLEKDNLSIPINNNYNDNKLIDDNDLNLNFDSYDLELNLNLEENNEPRKLSKEKYKLPSNISQLDKNHFKLILSKYKTSKSSKIWKHFGTLQLIDNNVEIDMNLIKEIKFCELCFSDKNNKILREIKVFCRTASHVNFLPHLKNKHNLIISLNDNLINLEDLKVELNVHILLMMILDDLSFDLIW